MKTHPRTVLFGALVLGTALSGTAFGAFDTLDAYGNAAGTTPPPLFTSNAGTITIRAGGEDFWGTSDKGAFLWDSTGTYTTTGDFTATVRHVSTTTPAPEWGRDAILVRATQTAGTPSANDAEWMACRKSNGQFVTGRRATPGLDTWRATDVGDAAVNFSSDNNDRALGTGNVTNTPEYLSAAREGDRMHAGLAIDCGNGVPGRWVEHWSTDNATAISGLQTNAEVVVGLAHQSHPQTISPDSNDVNIGTFDRWTYAGTYDTTYFGPASGSGTWQIGGNVAINSNGGAVTGAAYVTEGGAATGEPVKWTVTVYQASLFAGTFDSAGSKASPKLMEVDDLVPAANFRHDIGGGTFEPGLLADIYLVTNAGNSIANLALIANNQPPMGTAVLPNIHWSNPGGVGYPDNGMGGNLFADAVEAANPGNGAFAAPVNQENFGVDHHGQIFIPADADRTNFGLPGEMLLFKDGVDDFCYLEVDGHVLINDNAWTGNFSTENGGGNIASLDVSDSKYNDGEWVNFRMITWEGGGGDTASLYWHAFDTNGTFTIDDVPGAAGSFVPVLAFAGTKKDPAAMEVADLVPPANFRQPDGVTPGLKADIYLHVNDGNFAALDAVTANPPDGTTVLPRIHWGHPDTGVGYPPNGMGGDLFSDAIPTWDATTDGQEDYGVNLTGQIFIPGDAARTTLNATGGNSLVAFEDGVDDFCYLEVDGVVLINDNDWTGNSSVDNGGGNISLFNASAAKFDDGEWVPFRMITWEGGGGDTASLYWSALDTNTSFQRGQLPGNALPPQSTTTGGTQIGSDTTTGTFLSGLPVGDWYIELKVENTGVSLTKRAIATVGPAVAPPKITAFAYDPTTHVLTLTFSSVVGGLYALEYTNGFQPSGAPPAPQKWTTVTGYSAIVGLAGSTPIVPLNTTTLVTPTGLLPDNSQSYFRIRKTN